MAQRSVHRHNCAYLAVFIDIIRFALRNAAYSRFTNEAQARACEVSGMYIPSTRAPQFEMGHCTYDDILLVDLDSFLFANHHPQPGISDDAPCGAPPHTGLASVAKVNIGKNE